MHGPAPLRLLALPVVLAAALAAAPASALADDPLATTTTATALTADAGVAAWRSDDGRLVVRFVGRAPITTAFRPPSDAVLDVGARHGGGAQLVYASGCSARSRQCALRTIALSAANVRSGTLSPRTVAHVRYGGGGAPAVAIDGSRIAYAVHGTTGTGRSRAACDVPYVQTTAGRRTTTRRLDRGHCAALTQLDLGEGRLAILARPTARGTEARIVAPTGGHSRTLQAESQGEESNYIGAVSIDRGALFTARSGIRQANVFTRFALKDYKKSEARAFLALTGPFTRDAGQTLYVEQPAGASFDCRGAAGLATCLIVTGTDPFAAGDRVLPIELAMTISPQPTFTDTPPSAVVTAARPHVTRTARVGSEPAGGVAVDLLTARVTTAAPTAPAPSGASGTTGNDGTVTIGVPGTPVPRMALAARSRAGTGGFVLQTPDTILLPTFVRMTATPERLADGRLRITGTISPAQPGRKVKLERRIERACQHVFGGALVTPSTVDTPAGCADRWSQNPLATAAVSADGASYAIDAATPADVYRVSLDFAGGADVFEGETAQITAP
ncbi:MAG: hypothetical protein JWP53_3022 [Conexibacter sp.]|jgi:hypothetical protein|nr:hypothetical protein [Conexibacter sp.]MDX6730197.1 hypothetical protein [Baekduia sp.]